MIRLASITATALVAAGSAFASPSGFVLRPIVVNGSSNLQAVGINDRGDVAATFYDSGANATGAGVIHDGIVTMLPQPNSAFGPPQAEAIDNHGRVLAWARNSGDGYVSAFLFAGGAYDSNYEFGLEAPFSNNGSITPNPFGFGGRKKVFFTYLISYSEPTRGSYGIPPNFKLTPSYNTYNTIESMNDQGQVAGVSYGLSGVGTVFAGRGDNFVAINVPSATSTVGGFINDTGAVAGSYKDSAGAQHGFVYNAGNYTSFDMPEAASSVTVSAINDNGRVVGSYTGTSDGQLHAFYYNGSVASSFGTWKGFDSLSVAINSNNKMVVRVAKQGASLVYESYKVTCTGNAC